MMEANGVVGGGGRTGVNSVVRAGEDRRGERHRLGVARIDIKASGAKSDAFVLENTFHGRGGPARHVHEAQDDWFYALEGEFEVEVGESRFSLSAGESLLAPRGVPHVWAHVGAATGRMLIVFSPAGEMEAFFRQVGRADAMPPLDPELWSAHGMRLLGPPLDIDAEPDRG